MDRRIRASCALIGADARARRVPFIDEDEATLAVDAALPLLEAAQVAPSLITRMVVTSSAGGGWAATAAIALGLKHAQIEELAADAWAKARAEASRSAPVLFLRSSAPRASVQQRMPDLVDAEAEADLRGHAPGKPGPAVTEDPVRVLDAARVDRLIRWDAQAPSAVPMGAYVPRATWDRTLEARYRILASVCPNGHRAEHPPRPTCADCGTATRVEPAPAIGRLYSFAAIGSGGGPSEFEPWQDLEGDYGVAVVEYERLKLRVAGMIATTDLSRLRIGMPMERVFRRLYAQEGAWRYGVKFRPARPQESI